MPLPRHHHHRSIKPSSIPPPTQHWPLSGSLAVLGSTTGLIGFGFWFITTEVVSIKVTSGQWWFFITLASLMIILSTVATFRTRLHGHVRFAVLIFILGLTAALTYLGIKHKPFDSTYTPLKLGLQPVFSGKDGLEVDEQMDDDETTKHLVEYSDVKYLPEPMDQGDCGSCWAVASATAISARYERMKEQSGNPINRPALTNCAPKGINMSRWHVSPQFLLDKDEAFGPPDRCTSESYGKCNGNTQLQGGDNGNQRS